MPVSITSIEVVTLPADRLAHLRSEQKRHKREEENIRSSLISHREMRVGARFHAVVSDRVRRKTGWQAVVRKLGAMKPQNAEHTSETTYAPRNPPRLAPKPQRRFTGPDKHDLEIPV